MDIPLGVTITGDTININYADNKYVDIPRVHLTGMFSTSTQIVMFGEGNFTFSTALALLRGGLWKGIIATTESSTVASFSEAKKLSQAYFEQNNVLIVDPAPIQKDYTSQLKLLADPPANTWQYSVDVTNYDINVKNKVAWLQCPWIASCDRTPEYNIGHLIARFMKHTSTKQDHGDYLLLGIVNLFPYVKEYMLREVLHEALDDRSSSVHGYRFLGGDIDLIKAILQHGYIHQTVYADTDIHFKIIQYHLTLIFQKCDY